jgi:hypothetical protein
MRRIKLSPDYYCRPLWEASPGTLGNIDPKSLPISVDLENRLTAWAKQYDEILVQDDPMTSGFKTKEAQDRFETERFKLAEDLQSELGDDFEVILGPTLWSVRLCPE